MMSAGSELLSSVVEARVLNEKQGCCVAGAPERNSPRTVAAFGAVTVMDYGPAGTPRL
jgi:hypothetical protein